MCCRKHDMAVVVFKCIVDKNPKGCAVVAPSRGVDPPAMLAWLLDAAVGDSLWLFKHQYGALLRYDTSRAFWGAAWAQLGPSALC